MIGWNGKDKWREIRYTLRQPAPEWAIEWAIITAALAVVLALCH